MGRRNFPFFMSLSTGLRNCASTEGCAFSLKSILGLWQTVSSIHSCSEMLVMGERRKRGTENEDVNSESKANIFFQA